MCVSLCVSVCLCVCVSEGLRERVSLHHLVSYIPSSEDLSPVLEGRCCYSRSVYVITIAVT